MPASLDSMPFGSAEAKERTGGDRRWPIRSNLMRTKRPDKVHYSPYEPALKNHGGAVPIPAQNPPASPFDCADAGPYSVTDECSVCMSQYFPASHTFTDDQAKAVLTSTVDTIKDDLSFLRDSLARHADFLVPRWKKKSREKRSTFLETHTQLFERRWGAVHLLDRVGPLERTYAGPCMIPRVRTIRKPEGGYANTLEFHTAQSLSDANLREEKLAPYRDSWFLPYLDVETLSEDPTLFLSMLHHRSSNEPEKWLTFDNANLVLVEHFIIMFFESWRTKDIMPWLVDYIFFETMHREAYWRQLAAESERMMRYLDILEGNPSVQAKQDFDQAVFIVQDLCIEISAVFEPQVQAGLLIQRGFERNFEFEDNASLESTNRTFSQIDCFPDDLLYWSMSTLGYDENRPFTMDPLFNFATIDYLCRNDPKEAARISPTMLDRLSDMSILSEAISSFRQDMTRNRSIDAQVAKVFSNHTTSPQDWIKKINAGHGKVLGDLLGPQLQQLCQDFPWPRGKQGLKWLEEATAARACLTQFWARFQDLWTHKLKEVKVSQRLIDEDIQLMSATSTTRHQQGLESEK
jgi:hypothetical protein